MAEKHLVRHWKGSRGSYNALKNLGALDAWTHYIVNESDGTVSEYFGNNQRVRPEGQLLTVKSVLAAEPAPSDITPYDRYLVGDDANGYKVIEYTYDNNYTLTKEEIIFDKKYGVRVEDRGLKNYVYVDNKLVSYDDVDCGNF